MDGGWGKGDGGKGYMAQVGRDAHHQHHHPYQTGGKKDGKKGGKGGKKSGGKKGDGPPMGGGMQHHHHHHHQQPQQWGGGGGGHKGGGFKGKGDGKGGKQGGKGGKAPQHFAKPHFQQHAPTPPPPPPADNAGGQVAAPRPAALPITEEMLNFKPLAYSITTPVRLDYSKKIRALLDIIQVHRHRSNLPATLLQIDSLCSPNKSATIPIGQCGPAPVLHPTELPEAPLATNTVKPPRKVAVLLLSNTPDFDAKTQVITRSISVTSQMQQGVKSHCLLANGAIDAAQDKGDAVAAAVRHLKSGASGLRVDLSGLPKSQWTHLCSFTYRTDAAKPAETNVTEVWMPHTWAQGFDLPSIEVQTAAAEEPKEPKEADDEAAAGEGEKAKYTVVTSTLPEAVSSVENNDVLDNEDDEKKGIWRDANSNFEFVATCDMLIELLERDLGAFFLEFAKQRAQAAEAALETAKKRKRDEADTGDAEREDKDAPTPPVEPIEVPEAPPVAEGDAMKLSIMDTNFLGISKTVRSNVVDRQRLESVLGAL
eukprot:gene9460-14684_t